MDEPRAPRQAAGAFDAGFADDPVEPVPEDDPDPDEAPAVEGVEDVEVEDADSDDEAAFSVPDDEEAPSDAADPEDDPERLSVR